MKDIVNPMIESWVEAKFIENFQKKCLAESVESFSYFHL